MTFLRFAFLAVLGFALAACATKTEPVGYRRVVYPDDVGHAYADPVTRWATPGDLVWLEAGQAYALEFAGGRASGRDPSTGQKVRRDLAGWRALEGGGDVLYFAPPWTFAPGGGPPAGVTGPPPYACARREEYWTAALTWTLGRCAAGRRAEGVPGWRWRADPYTWSEIAVRYVGQEAGQAVFAYRSRMRLDAQGGGTSAELRAAPGETARNPQGLGGSVDVQVLGFESGRVRYRLARRVIPCTDPSGCVEEGVAAATRGPEGP